MENKKTKDEIKQVFHNHRFYIKGFDMLDYLLFIFFATVIIKLVWKFIF